MREDWLASYLRSVTDRLRGELPTEQRRRLEERDQAEQQQLEAGTHAMQADLALPGRQTGDAAWLAARGEDGATANADAAGATSKGSGSSTRYRWARDEALQQQNLERICGGAVRASGAS